jgi:7-keto-8-aminopelargonate synthetase-like enzyme
MGTLGKALGCQGGFLVGPQPLIRALHNRARTFIYATALAVPVVAAACEALRVLEDDPSPRLRLAQQAQRLQEELQAAGAMPPRPPSHILSIVLGSSARALRAAAALWEQGIFAPAIRPPTVPDGTARLRLSVSALHTDEQITQLVQALRRVCDGDT